MEGIAWFAWETLQRITAAHPEHRFYFIFDRPWHESFLTTDNVVPLRTRLPSRHPLLWYQRFHHAIPNLLQQHRIDLFYSPDGWNVPAPFPSVVALHDLNFWHTPENLPFATRYYYRTFFPQYASDARRLITVSEYSKQDIVDSFSLPAEKIDVVYNAPSAGFRPLSLTEKEQVQKEFAQGKPYFAFVGALNPRKNLLRLLEAFDQFCHTTSSDLMLIVAGEAMWSNTPFREAYKAMHHSSRVLFLNRRERGEIMRLIGGAEALLLPSTFEGFGIPIVEAMQCDVPVLTSNVTAMPEVAGDAALYVNPFSIGSIADGLRLLANDPLRRADLVSKGRVRRLRYSWDHAAFQVWESLEKAMY